MPKEENNVKFTKILSYFWIVVQKYLWPFLGIFIFFGIARVLSTIVLPLYYKKLIDVISLSSDPTSVAPIVLTLFGFIAALLITYNLFYRVGDYIITYFQTAVMRDLSDLSFKKMQEHSYAFFANTFSGGLVARARRFVRAFEVMHDQIVWAFWMAIIQLTGTFIVVFTIEPILGTFYFLWTLMYVLFTVFLARKKMSYDVVTAALDSRVTAQLADALTNILNIKIFSAEKREEDTFGEVTEEHKVAHLRGLNFGNLINLIQGVFMILLEGGSLYIAIRLWMNGTVSAGTVVLVQIYSTAILAILWQLGRAMNRFAQSVSDSAEMIEIFEEPIEVRDVDDPISFSVDEGTIEFNDMSFEYKDGKEVLNGFSLSIPSCQKVGLVGASGAGKTTITKLLLRFADVTKGEILIDGQNIAHAQQSEVRKAVSYVPQEPLLFHRSLGENIAYGKTEASMEEIIDASRKARAHDFITSFKYGYDTLVGERGVKLSGGERQRVAIARAMLENAPILVLDEATSSLDSISEKAIQEAFEELLRDKTAIVIAHRLSTIQKMDRIIVMDHGRIVEDGTHTELLEHKGVYYNLWKHQHDGFLADN